MGKKLKVLALFDAVAPTTIDQDLGNVGVHDQVFERLEERKDQVEAHDTALIVG